MNTDNIVKIKNIHIFGGGTMAHITNHFSVCAPAYGNTAKQLKELVTARFGNTSNVFLELTKMAGGRYETNEDIKNRIEALKTDFNTKIIFFNCALVDFEPYFSSETYHKMIKDNGSRVRNSSEFGKYADRLDTKNMLRFQVYFQPTDKIISNIRTGRKDIFLVGFKTTCGATKQEMYEKGLALCKGSSVNLVLVNDTKTHWNQIITPEEAVYHETDNRYDVLKNLVDMTFYRSQLTFTQSTVVDGKPVSWNDSRIPDSIRTVVNYCIENKAYKPFGEKKSTAGHFAIKLSDNEFLSSIRKTNLNDIDKIGMVYVKTDGPDTVVAFGAKPSVGGQSQRIVFRDHVGYDCIVHFHSGLKKDHRDNIPIVSQRENECGSHSCGKATSTGLQQFGNLKCVMLDNHGPNIVFNQSINPQEVIDFINVNFDLSKKTGGYQI